MNDITKKWLSRQQLIDSYPVPKTRQGLKNWVQKYGFPEPFYVTPNHPTWIVDVVNEWFREREGLLEHPLHLGWKLRLEKG